MISTDWLRKLTNIIETERVDISRHRWEYARIFDERFYPYHDFKEIYKRFQRQYDLPLIEEEGSTNIEKMMLDIQKRFFFRDDIVCNVERIIDDILRYRNHISVDTCDAVKSEEHKKLFESIFLSSLTSCNTGMYGDYSGRTIKPKYSKSDKDMLDPLIASQTVFVMLMLKFVLSNIYTQSELSKGISMSTNYDAIIKHLLQNERRLPKIF